jgi:hypothetical protein
VAFALLATSCSAGTTAAAPPSSSPPELSAQQLAATARAFPYGRELGGTSWPTYHGDSARSGVSTSMPPVSGRPRVLASLRLDAAVYAAPIAVDGVIVMATENDTLYGLTSSGRQIWKRRLGAPARLSQLPCGNIDPSGITGTPVYAGASHLVYAVTEHANPVRHDLVGVDLRTGAVRLTRPLALPGTSQDAMQQRGALTVTGGRVWIPFGGRSGDCGSYKGQLVGVPLTGAGGISTYTVPTAREAGIWTPPGPSVDSSGRMLVAVGNGASVVAGRYDHSDSVLSISAGATLVDSFSPSTWAQDNAVDADLGSQGPAIVGPWVFSAGKSGTAYVLRRSHLGGIGGQVSAAPLCRSFGGTAVAGDVVYVPCTTGVTAVRVDARGTMHRVWQADGSVIGSPVVGGGRVWSLSPSSGVLAALDPRDGATSSTVQVGETSRFATPALYGRDVLVPTLTGLVIVRTS